MTLYDKNLQAIPHHHGELLALLAQPIRSEHLKVTRAASGASRLFVTTEGGETVAIHNAEDPLSIAEQTAAKVHQEGVIVLMGMGLGYLACALARRIEEGAALIVYEADPAIFKTAMELVDLTPLLSSSRVKVLVGEDADLGPWAYHFHLQTGGSVRVLRFEPAFRLAPTLYEKKLTNNLWNPTFVALTNLETARHFGPIFTQAILEAVPHIIEANGVDELYHAFPNIPAILVGGGPSLAKNVYLLRKAKGRAVIIAADTMLGYLLARGIAPDFVVSVDPQEETYHKYEGVDIPEGVALVFHPSCHANIVKHFPGPKFVTETGMPAYQWLREYWPVKGSIEGDIQCQMHMAFNLAQRMSCDPIILIGQDLCYTDDRMHVKSGSYLTPQEEENHVRQGVKTTTMFGETVGTYPVFLSYKHTFEKKIQGHSGLVINATQGGVNLEGAENWRLDDVLDAFCSGKTLDRGKVCSPQTAASPKCAWQALLDEIQKRCKDFFRLERVSRRLCRLLESIRENRQKFSGRDEQIIRLTGQAERLTGLVPRYGKALDLLQLIDFRLELYMTQEQTCAIDTMEDEFERLDKQVQRGLRFYGDIMKAARVMRGHCERLLARLKRMQDLEGSKAGGCNDGEVLTEITRLADLDLYSRAATVWAEARGHTRQQLDDEQMTYWGVVLPMKLHQIRVASERAQAASNRFPHSPYIQESARRAIEAWKLWQGRVKAAREEEILFQESPTAAGDFYFRVGNFTKATGHYRRIALDPKLSIEVRGEGWYRTAKAQQALGCYEMAVEALEQALLTNPADPRVYYDLGIMALTEHQLDVAERFFLKGAQISLDDPEFCEAAAAVFCAAGAYQKAISFYERALAHNPANPQLLKKIAQVYQAIFTP